MIDVRKLRMLSELQRNGTIAAVAESLHLTASGVSMQLSALERELGVPLTERRGRRVVLTPAGVLLAQHGHEILDRLSLAELEVDALRRGAVGQYSIAAFPSAARTFVADSWRDLIDEGSGLELRVVTLEPEDALAALSAGEVDLAVIHAYSNVPRDIPNGIDARVISTDPVRLAVPGAGDGEGDAAADLADFADRRWIVPAPGVTCHSMVDRACGLAGFRPDVVAESMDFSVQLALVAAGVGVALVPDLTVVSMPPNVRLLPLKAPVSRSIFVAARSSGARDRGIAEVAARLEASARRTTGARATSVRPG
ncbi:MAG: LysR family transcriptional regulator [Mycetocola sp.]